MCVCVCVRLGGGIMMKKVEMLLVLPGEADSLLWMCDPTHTDRGDLVGSHMKNTEM